MVYTPEAVLEASRHGLEVAHTASASGLSALGLLAPLVRPELRAGVAALRTLCDEVSQSTCLERITSGGNSGSGSEVEGRENAIGRQD